MEYVDGGWRKVVNIFGAGVRLSGSETSRFLSYYSWITGAISFAAGLANGTAGAIAGVIYSAYGGTIQKFNSNNSGVTIVIKCTCRTYYMKYLFKACAIMSIIGMIIVNNAVNGDSL
ncbi:MAG TPA: hypothetical protein VHO66_02305 [Ruminiclostridium sp.]|nr:hypothetical protein [Ruminiclostridium sp.]